MNRAEVIIHNMQSLIEAYEQAENDNELDEVYWWEDECGTYLTDMIDCHVVFKGEPPCLLEERKLSEYMPSTATKEERVENQIRCQAACAECKARWLMREYE